MRIWRGFCRLLVFSALVLQTTPCANLVSCTSKAFKGFETCAHGTQKNLSSLRDRERYQKRCTLRWRQEVIKYSAAQKMAVRSVGDKTKIVTWRCHDGAERETCNGLGDRLSGISTAFIFALCTNRIFLLDWDLVSSGFRPRYFDWTFDDLLLKDRTRRVVQIGTNGVGGFVPLFNSTDTDFPEDVIEFYGTNRAMLHELISGEFRKTEYRWWNRRIYNLGLGRQNGFGCLMRALFRPSAYVNHAFRKEFQRIDLEKSFTMGIHMRTGDDVLAGAAADDLNFDILSNASKVAQFLNPSGHKVRLFFVSDSLMYRTQATTHMKTLSMDVDFITPSIVPSHVSSASHSDVSGIHTSIVSAAGEWWLLTFCNINLVLSSSGYSRTAYAFALAPVLYDFQVYDDADCFLSKCITCTQL